MRSILALFLTAAFYLFSTTSQAADLLPSKELEESYVPASPPANCQPRTEDCPQAPVTRPTVETVIQTREDFIQQEANRDRLPVPEPRPVLPTTPVIPLDPPTPLPPKPFL